MWFETMSACGTKVLGYSGVKSRIAVGGLLLVALSVRHNSGIEIGAFGQRIGQDRIL
jgi:hypothetical protein